MFKLHKSPVDRKYWKLFSSPGNRRKPGPEGLSPELITAIVEMKSRNPKFGCIRIAQQISLTFVVAREYIDGVTVCRMFNEAIACQPRPKHLSTDHDPLFRFHRWRANLRILEIEEIKSLPYVPTSHPFIERLIGTVRPKHFDRVFFWNLVDLARKLKAFGNYYNEFRVHRSLDGTTPAQHGGMSSPASAVLRSYVRRQHCQGLFQTPRAA